MIAAIFLVGDLLGPYKVSSGHSTGLLRWSGPRHNGALVLVCFCVQGLYCCVKETQYRAYAVAPVILITFTAIFAMTYLYYMVRHTHEETKATGAPRLTGVCGCVWCRRISTSRPWRTRGLALQEVRPPLTAFRRQRYISH